MPPKIARRKRQHRDLESSVQAASRKGEDGGGEGYFLMEYQLRADLSTAGAFILTIATTNNDHHILLIQLGDEIDDEEDEEVDIGTTTRTSKSSSSTNNVNRFTALIEYLKIDCSLLIRCIVNSCISMLIYE